MPIRYVTPILIILLLLFSIDPIVLAEEEPTVSDEGSEIVKEETPEENEVSETAPEDSSEESSEKKEDVPPPEVLDDDPEPSEEAKTSDDTAEEDVEESVSEKTVTEDAETPEEPEGNTTENPEEEEEEEVADRLSVPKVFINEIKIAGTSVSDEFIEIRNPTDQDISLSGLKLCRRTSGTSISTIKSFSSDHSVPANGYFLFANSDGIYAEIADTTTKSSPLSENNSVALADSCSKDPEAIVDSVAWGTGAAWDDDAPRLDNPSPKESLVRDPKTRGWSVSTDPTPTNRLGETMKNDTETEEDADKEAEEPAAVPLVGTIVINEILPYPDTGEAEWMELRNGGADPIDLSGWKIGDLAKSYPIRDGTVIDGDGFVVIDASESKIALNNTGTETVTLRFPDGTEAFSFTYSKTEKGASYAWDGSTLRITHVPTRGTENVFDPEPIIAPVPPVGTIIINEIFPNPEEKGEANEWIELKNTGAETVSLAGWAIGSGAGTFVLSEKYGTDSGEILPGGFLVFPRSLTRLALRNTDGKVTLVAPDGTLMDAVPYGKTVEGASYGSEKEKRFRWTATPTPGKENRFGEAPKAKRMSVPKNGYPGVLLPFSTEGNKADMRFVWDFGDGHKSYLETTSHRYEKIGTYRGTLTIRDGVEEAVKPFTIRIVKYPSYELRIIGICPNPKGNDTDTEWIAIRNDGRKGVDLSGWIIATGASEEKLVNHAVLTNRSIRAGETVVLTRLDARFTLPNREAVIALRRPDGKTVQTVRYSLEKTAKENAVYADSGKGWEWIATADDSFAEKTSIGTETVEVPEEQAAPTFVAPKNPDSGKISFSEFVALGTSYRIELPDSLPHLLGAEDRHPVPENLPDSWTNRLFHSLNRIVIEIVFG